MTKAELRKLYLEKRKALTADELLKKNRAIAALLFSRLMIHRFGRVHAYLPIAEQNEVDTWPIIQTLWNDFPAEIFVPKILAGGQLSHHLLNPNTILHTNKWGIDEPNNEGFTSENFFTTDQGILVIVPLLAFDKNRNRVGYGKGFYDRFLHMATPNTLIVGLSFFEAEDQITDTDATDIPLHHVITPLRVYGGGLAAV